MRSILSELINEEVNEKAKELAIREDIISDAKRKLQELLHYYENQDTEEEIDAIINIENKIANEYSNQRMKVYRSMSEIENYIEKKYTLQEEIKQIAKVIDAIKHAQYVMNKDLYKDVLDKNYVYTRHLNKIICSYIYPCYEIVSIDDIRRVIERLKSDYGITDEMLSDELFDKYIEKMYNIKELYEDEEEEIKEKTAVYSDALVQKEENNEIRNAIIYAIELIEQIQSTRNIKEKEALCRDFIYHINNYREIVSYLTK